MDDSTYLDLLTKIDPIHEKKLRQAQVVTAISFLGCIGFFWWASSLLVNVDLRVDPEYLSIGSLFADFVAFLLICSLLGAMGMLYGAGCIVQVMRNRPRALSTHQPRR